VAAFAHPSQSIVPKATAATAEYSVLTKPLPRAKPRGFLQSPRAGSKRACRTPLRADDLPQQIPSTVASCCGIPIRAPVFQRRDIRCIPSFRKALSVSKKIYVGNLPYSVTDSTLESNFAEFGRVSSAKVMMDRETGRSKGFGFVEMASAEVAQAAITGLNGMSVDGRSIVVNLARPREEGSGSGGYSEAGYSAGKRSDIGYGTGGYGGGRY